MSRGGSGKKHSRCRKRAFKAVKNAEKDRRHQKKSRNDRRTPGQKTYDGYVVEKDEV